MLKIGRFVTTITVAAGLVLSVSTVVAADGDCQHTSDPWCTAEDSGPGTPGGGGGGCTWQGTSVPCQDPDYGYYTGGGCYFKPLDTTPAGSPPAQDMSNGVWGYL